MTLRDLRLTTLAGAREGGPDAYKYDQTFSNFKIEGDVVATPEPSSFALVGVGALALLFFRSQTVWRRKTPTSLQGSQ